MRKILTAIILSLIFFTPAGAAHLDLAWNPNTEPDLAGYRIYYGTASREYVDSIDVGNTTTYGLDGLLEGVTYYIALTAYDTTGNESGFSDEVSSDTGGDGMPDDWEIEYFGDTNQEPGSDYDGDGLNNLGEYQHGTDPTVPDTDSDQMPDGWEVQYGFNPLDASDGNGDSDGDGFTNWQEYLAGSDPRSAPPSANAGPDEMVDEGTTVILDGSNSRDSDDGIASYLWEQTGGIPVGLCDPTAAQPSFVSPDVGPDGVSLTFRLTVTDSGGLQDSDTCIVNVTWVNIPPVADAGADQTMDEGTTVTLDASNSSDVDDGIGSYLWEQTTGITVSLSDPRAVQSSFTSPDVGPGGASLTFQLTVADNGGLQATDTCIVNVSWVNTPPMPDAGPDQTVTLPDNSVFLDATVTDDGLPGAVSTSWSQVSGPGTVDFDDASAVDTTASFSEAGTYVLQLTADDGELSASDEVTILVNKHEGEIVTVEVRVAAGSDDAEEDASGDMGLRSSDLELVYDGGDQTVGIRFTGVDIPQGATIVNAYVQLQADETSSGKTSLMIEGQDTDDASTFVSSDWDISSRSRTLAAVSWFPEAWTTVGEAGPDQRTPDISPVIQEIVDRSGWSSGNSLVVIITGTGQRVAESYNGNQGGAPLLHVDYSIGEL